MSGFVLTVSELFNLPQDQINQELAKIPTSEPHPMAELFDGRSELYMKYKKEDAWELCKVLCGEITSYIGDWKKALEFGGHVEQLCIKISSSEDGEEITEKYNRMVDIRKKFVLLRDREIDDDEERIEMEYLELLRILEGKKKN